MSTSIGWFNHEDIDVQYESFEDPLTFPLTPRAGQHLHLSSEISKHFEEGLAKKKGFTTV